MAEMSATEAKNKFGQLLEMARTEPVRIQKNGRDIAVLMSAEEHAQLVERAGAAKVRPVIEQLLERSITRRKSLYEALAK